MCRALKVLCAAPGRERLLDLKRATVSVHWELVGGATTTDELVNQVDRFAPDVIVIDAALGPDPARRVRTVRPNARILAFGEPMDDADAFADAGGVRDAILGLPPVGGPVGV